MPDPSRLNLPQDQTSSKDLADDNSDTWLPQIRGYEIKARLGRGGMGTVWRAIQLGTSREVAIKLMSERMFASESARYWFQREVRLHARLNHPHIARIYDSGLDQGFYYYAMELVEGMPLDRYVRERNLPVRQTLELFRHICLAVQHAHQLGVIHLDLKPSNILVTETVSRGCWISDWPRRWSTRTSVANPPVSHPRRDHRDTHAVLRAAPA